MIIKRTCEDVDFNALARLLESVDVGKDAPDLRKAAFENSEHVIFVYKDNELVGCGRIVTDNVLQAMICDIGVSNELQGNGLGRTIVEELISELSETESIMLFANPGKEDFYEKFGFRKAKSGMLKFTNADEMRRLGFTE